MPGDSQGQDAAVPRAPRTGLGGVIARNAVFNVAGRLVFLFAWALATPYMLHVLGEERFAIWALFFALSGYFATFDLGISQSLMKFVAQYWAEGNERALRGIVTLGTTVYIVLIIPIVTLLVLLRDPILDAIHTPAALRAEAGASLVGMAVVLGATNLVAVLTAVLAGRQRLDVASRISLIVTFLQVGGAILVLSLGWGLVGLVFSTGIGVLVSGILSWRAVRDIDEGFRFDFAAIELGMLKRLLRFSFALQITNIGSFLQFQLDKILLAHYATFAVVTRYELATRLTVAAWAIPYLVLVPLVPAAAELNSQDDMERIVRLYRRASRYLFVVAVPIAAFEIACAPGLVTLWLGPGYREVAVTTVFMILFMVIITATGVGTAISRGIGEPWMEARYHMMGAATHIALSLWLVPRYGLRGSLFALVASGAISSAFFLAQLHSRLRESTPRWLVATTGIPIVVSAVAAVVLVPWASGWNQPFVSRSEAMRVLAAGAVFAVTIFAGYFATRHVTLSELRQLGGLMRSRAAKK